MASCLLRQGLQRSSRPMPDIFVLEVFSRSRTVLGDRIPPWERATGTCAISKQRPWRVYPRACRRGSSRSRGQARARSRAVRTRSCCRSASAGRPAGPTAEQQTRQWWCVLDRHVSFMQICDCRIGLFRLLHSLHSFISRQNVTAKKRNRNRT